MRIVRRIFLLAFVALLVVVVSTLTTPPASYPGTPAGVHPLIGRVFEGAWTVVAWASHYPVYAGALVAVVAVPFLIGEGASWVPRRVHRDAQRLFTPAQKAAGSARAGGRCEMETIFFTRCRRPGEHGDHWFPHSKGGATSMENYVHACARHNLAKGGRVPTFWETQRLDMRRRRYFPAGQTARPGDKIRV